MIPVAVADFTPMAFMVHDLFLTLGLAELGRHAEVPNPSLGCANQSCTRAKVMGRGTFEVRMVALPSLHRLRHFLLVCPNFCSLMRRSGSAKAQGRGSRCKATVGQGSATSRRTGRIRPAKAVPIQERERLRRVGVESSKSPQP